MTTDNLIVDPLAYFGYKSKDWFETNVTFQMARSLGSNLYLFKLLSSLLSTYSQKHQPIMVGVLLFYIWAHKTSLTHFSEYNSGNTVLRAATAGKTGKVWSLPRFWVSIRSDKK